MIERYALFEIEKLTDRFGLTNGVPKGVKKRYNISPTQLAPVIVHTNDVTELRMMNWGIVPQGSKDMNSVFRYKTFNTQSEKVFASPVRAEMVKHQRCIVPMNGYYDWDASTDEKVPYFLSAGDQALLPVAGMYSTFTDSSDIERQTFSIITIAANDKVPFVHKRMPVILHADDEKLWLSAEISDFSSLVRIMRPYENDALATREVSPAFRSAKVDDPTLIARV